MGLQREMLMEEIDENENEKEIKGLRQWIARANNKLFRKKVRRKATKKEKRILQQLKIQMGKELTSNNLKIAKEQWTDKLRYKKVNPFCPSVAIQQHLVYTLYYTSYSRLNLHFCIIFDLDC